MRQLFSFLANPFVTLRVGVAPLVRFSSDHLQRLISQNDQGQFDEQISATESALNRLHDAYTSDIGKMGLRKSRRVRKNLFRKELLEKIATIHGTLISVFGSRSMKLKEFFPEGRNAFKRCADDILGSNLEALLEQIEAHVDRLGAGLVSEVNGILEAWREIHNHSASSKGAKAQAEAERRDARAALEDQLFSNLLRIASLNRGKPERIGMYMQQYLLEPHRRTAGDASDFDEERPDDWTGEEIEDFSGCLEKS